MPKKVDLFFLAVLLLGLVSSSVLGQSRSDLEKRKREALSKIKEAEKILKETQSEKKASIGQLTALIEEIKAQSKLIKSLKSEISYVSEDITTLNIVVNALEDDLINLKEEYSELVYATHKASFGYNKLAFLFASESFNQLFRRLSYLEQYGAARKKQVFQITKVKEELQAQHEDLLVKKEEKDKLLRTQLRQSRKLATLKVKQKKLVAELNKKAKEIKKQIAAKRKSIDKLDRLIASLIKNEIEKSRVASRPDPSKSVDNLGQVALEFERSKNKLTWPVDGGFISGKFGEHPHPVFKNVKVVNMGVDIQTSKEAVVKPVFKGKVSRVGYIPGVNSFVMVQHGKYFTVYAKLKSINVKQGQVISKDTPIGYVFTDKEGKSEVQFQVWKGSEKLNPEQWLAKR